MNLPPNFLIRPSIASIPENFWQCILKDEQLRDCSNLEKLLAGCEIIAALDEIDILLAA